MTPPDKRSSPQAKPEGHHSLGRLHSNLEAKDSPASPGTTVRARGNGGGCASL